ncbi:MAG: asparagine synthase (glutamine-hydrolyzing) [Cyclobacteriaceae bacterium]
MCGISGLISKDQLQRPDIFAMTMALTHRGPDAQDVYFAENATVALGHTRLSVIDLSVMANQPMLSADGRYSIVFNGEIYNYRSLREELIRLNAETKFSTQSDTEVILQGYIQWGSELCARLEGMFAFAIYDQQQNELFLCRDSVGKKPLYYFRNGNLFAFASEIKSLLKHPVISADRSVNYDEIYTFLHIGYIPEPHTAYKSIRKFPSGHYAYVRKDLSIDFISYRNLLEYIKEPVGGNSWNVIKELKSTLMQAVGRRLTSDVPLGAFLSGGTDSSLIVAMASQLKSDSLLKTFSIGFAESQYDESSYARRVARELKSDHCEFMLSENEALSFLEKYFTHFDEPFADTSAIPMMLVSKLARKEVTVALTGDGGDELFLGYGAYDWANRLDQFWVSLFQSPLSYALKKLGNSRLKRIGFLLEKVHSHEIRSHIFSQEQYYFSRSEIVAMSLKMKSGFETLDYQDPGGTHLNSAEKQALFDIQHYLKDDLLVKVDRASMFYGLECRCPFLDPQVIALAMCLPYEVKKKGQVRKWILKEILREYLPDDLVYRPKWGFSIPLGRWMKNELAYLIDQYLNEEIVEGIGIVGYPHVQNLKNSFFSGDDFLYNRLWVLIVAHKWLNDNVR